MTTVDFSQVFYSSPLPICIIQDGCFKMVNPKITQITGYTAEGMLKLQCIDLVHPEEKRWLQNVLLQHSEGLKTCADYEFRVINRTGEVFYLRGFFSTIEFNGRAAILAQILDITEQKQSETELCKSEELLRAITASTTDMICLTDADLVIHYATPYHLRVLGVAPEEIVGESVFDRVHPDDLPGVRAHTAEALKNKSNGKAVFRFRHNAGHYIWLESHGNLLLDEKGEVSGATFVNRDITERKLAEEKLHATNRQLFDIIDFLPDATFVIDHERKVIAWNRAMEKMTGIPKGEILGKGNSFYSAPFYWEPTPMLIDLIFSNDREHELQYNFFERQGNLLFAENFTPAFNDGKGGDLWGTASPLFDSEGNLTGAIESIRNITARKRIDEELQRINKAVENSSNAVVMTDTMGKHITYCNKSFQDLFGYTAEELSGAGGLHVLFPNSATAQEVYRTLINGHSWKGELRKTTRQNKVVQFYMHGDALRDETGKVTGLFAIYTDITKLKQAEIEIKKAKEIAEAANRAKSTFLANMSHEIRTPVNAMLGMSELLLGMPMSKEQKEFVTTIHDSGQHLLTIINAILDLSKIEAGKIVVETVAFDPLSLFNEFVKVMATKAGKKNLAFKTSFAYDGPPLLHGDPVRLRQVLFNLIDNAVKFTDHGELELRATMKPLDETHVAMRFEVSDTGIGISDKDHDKLFQPFSQINGSTTRTHGGTGLGLAISKRLVTLMGGEIGADSKKGCGSTFWFTAPLGIPDIKEELPENKKPSLVKIIDHSDPEPEPAEMSDLILVAEDNPVNQKLILAQLSKLGYRAHMVSTGREAVESVLNTSYALILMDCQMPVMDGFEATGAIRNNEPALGRYTPIIAITAHAMKGDREKCINAGMNDYLSKPISLNQLQKKLERWMPLREPAQERDGETNLMPPGPAGQNVIDPGILESLRRLQTHEMPDLFSNLVKIYLSSTPALLLALKEAIREKNMDALHFAAHSLKSSSSNIGALRLSSLAQELESLDAENGAGSVAEILDQVKIEFEKVKEALKTYLF